MAADEALVIPYADTSTPLAMKKASGASRRRRSDSNISVSAEESGSGAGASSVTSREGWIAACVCVSEDSVTKQYEVRD